MSEHAPEPTPATPGRTARRSTWRIVCQVLLTSVVVWFAADALWKQWAEVDRAAPVWNLRPSWIAASSLLVVLIYALLIETWRRTLIAWGSPVHFLGAARVWSVSNLGKYVPGKIWQVSAMAVMLQRLGVSLAVAGASAVVITLANLAAGFGVVSLFGAGAVSGSRYVYALSVALVVALMAGLAASPVLVPRVAAAAQRAVGITLPRMVVPKSVPWVSTGGCLLAWVGYGIAFRFFMTGVVGHAPGAMTSYIAVFTGSYLLGYMALFAPGGIGVRELALAKALPALGLATPAEAALVTVASRLWLTVLEILPGLLFMLVKRRAAR